jgi:hypothetical protein
MPFQVAWDDPAQTCIRYDVTGKWTTQEFWQAFQKAKQMIEAVDHPVNFIVHMQDESSRGHLPSGFIMHLANLYRNAHPRAGRTVVVPKTAGTIQHFDFVDTLEEAQQLLHRGK